MQVKTVKIGYAPTRRDCFTHPEAQVMRKQILEKIKEIATDVEVVDIDGINTEGLIVDESDVSRAVALFKEKDIDGLFIPHCNFGMEVLVARIALALNKPVLLWGPRDDVPPENVDRTRDTQCGLFATGKALRRVNVPFTYLTNTTVGDPVFTEGYKNFVAVCATVRDFRSIRVLQVGVRPDPFWTVMYNESELLERFNIQVVPITLQDLNDRMEAIAADKADVEAQAKQISATFNALDVDAPGIKNIAILKLALLSLTKQRDCGAVAIHCWGSLQKATGVATCTVNGLLTEVGIPVACETDVHGAISSILIAAASRYASSTFFADLTIRHPHNDNAELLWHCGNFPPSLAKSGCTCNIKCVQTDFGPFPSQSQLELRGGDITVCRFDGDHGEYKLFIGEGKGVDGPHTTGTYVWFEVDDWPRWEEQLVTGPYVHHCTGVHAKVAHILFEACKYIGVKADPATPNAESLQAYWRHPL